MDRAKDRETGTEKGEMNGRRKELLSGSENGWFVVQSKNTNEQKKNQWNERQMVTNLSFPKAAR